MVLPAIGPLGPTPLDEQGLVRRLQLTAASVAYVALGPPALLLAIGSVLVLPLTLAIVGLPLALAVVPATEALTGVHRRISGALLGAEIPSGYADTSDAGLIARPARWLRDGARWRDVAFLWFSATGGLVMSLLPAALLSAPVTYLVLALVDGGSLWWVLFGLGGPMLAAWWVITPALVQARTLADRGILGHSRLADLERRVADVATSRSETLDHSAAEIRRIERDIHDGPQARIAAVGMNVGLAEKLVRSDPDAAATLLREARDTTVAALEDLRSVVRGIHPPALADRGLAGGIEALAVQLPIPVTVSLALPASLPAPVQSAAYFAVTECLANAVKHAEAARAWVKGFDDGDSLHLVVGDDGRGGADPAGDGLAGIARRLAAFDGTVTVDSPEGGPTVITMELPWPTDP
jgi:signal transduction histidine kinase